jgi:predicted DNA-binding ribbon-helix-helix protein
VRHKIILDGAQPLGGHMKSAIVKRSVVIDGHKTSVSLEEPFWILLRDIAEAGRISVSALLCDIDRQRKQSNLSSAIRVHVLGIVRARAEATERTVDPPPADVSAQRPTQDLRAL